jgi:hypothetical protein
MCDTVELHDARRDVALSEEFHYARESVLAHVSGTFG